MEVDQNYVLKKLEIENKFWATSMKFNYPGSILAKQRVLGPPTFLPSEPLKGTEIYSKIPIDLFEDELFPFFNAVAPVYKMRLLMGVSGLFNRGVVYVMYRTAAEAKLAINVLSGKEIRPRVCLYIKKSFDNKRLFIGNVSMNKSRDEIWQELLVLGMKNIVDVISYPGYNPKNHNRGYVFVEFATHEQALEIRNNYKHFVLFGLTAVVDWSIPLTEFEEDVMSKVKILFITNLSVTLEKSEFENVIKTVLDPEKIMKVFKFKNYSFVHLDSRSYAEEAFLKLTEHFSGTGVRVDWAKPRDHTNTPEYRRQILCTYKNKRNITSKNVADDKPSRKAVVPNVDVKSNLPSPQLCATNQIVNNSMLLTNYNCLACMLEELDINR